jgi:hypothetical protein
MESKIVFARDRSRFAMATAPMGSKSIVAGDRSRI